LPALETQFDALVIDSGSGMTPWSRRLWQRAELALLVTTPDDTAVIDAYTTIKQSSTGKPATDVRVLVNKCDHASVAVDVQQRIAAACQRFLGRAVGRAPRLPSARDVWNSYGPPLSWDDVASPFGRSVTQLGRFVVDVLSQRRYASAIAAGCNPLALEFSPC
jgi:MinD-like ATPase involved in chromosome partitioning or flagellar assembly